MRKNAPASSGVTISGNSSNRGVASATFACRCVVISPIGFNGQKKLPGPEAEMAVPPKALADLKHHVHQIDHDCAVLDGVVQAVRIENHGRKGRVALIAISPSTDEQAEKIERPSLIW